MKNSALLVITFFLGIFACQQVKPPKEVSDAFAAKFAAAENIQWEQEEENVWEADFMLDGKEISACFDNSGTWIETETVININELPQAISDTLKMKFEGYQINEAESIEKSDFNGFEIIMEMEDEELEILITTDGEIISKNVVEEDEEKGEEEGEEEEEDDDESGDGDDDDY